MFLRQKSLCLLQSGLHYLALVHSKFGVSICLNFSKGAQKFQGKKVASYVTPITEICASSPCVSFCNKQGGNICWVARYAFFGRLNR